MALRDFTVNDWVSISEVVNSAESFNLGIDLKMLHGYLFRKSILPGKVAGKVISDLLLPALKKKTHTPMKKNLKKNFKSGKVSENKVKLKGIDEFVLHTSSNKVFLHPDSNLSGK